MDVVGNGYGTLSQSAKQFKTRVSGKLKERKVARWVKSFDQESKLEATTQEFRKAIEQSGEQLLISVFERSKPELKVHLLESFSQSADRLIKDLSDEDVQDCLSKMSMIQTISFAVKKQRRDIPPFVERRIKLGGFSKAAEYFMELPDSSEKKELIDRFSFESQFLLAGFGRGSLEEQFWDNFINYTKKNGEFVLKVLSRFIGVVPQDFLISCIEKLPDKLKIRLLRFLDIEAFKQVADNYIPLFDQLIQKKSTIKQLKKCTGPHIQELFNAIQNQTQNKYTKKIFKLNNHEIDVKHSKFFNMQLYLTKLIKNKKENAAHDFLKNHEEYCVLLKEMLLKTSLKDYVSGVLEKKMAQDLLKFVDTKSFRRLDSCLMKVVLTFSSFISDKVLLKSIRLKIFDKETSFHMKKNLYGLMCKLLEVRPDRFKKYRYKELLSYQPANELRAAKRRFAKMVKRSKNLIENAGSGSPRPSEESCDNVLELYCAGKDCEQQFDKLTYDIKLHTIALIQKVGIEEFLNLKWISAGPISGMQKLIKHSNDLSAWVKHNVYHNESNKKSELIKRGAKISFFIDLCYKLIEIGDFYSCFPIYTALCCSESKNLKKSWVYVKKKTSQKLEELKPLFDGDSNFRHLRKKIVLFTNDNEKSAYCFPIQFISRDLEKTFQMADWDCDHINYDKVEELYRQFDEFYRCKMRTPQNIPKAYTDFRHSLRGIPISLRDY